MDKNNSLRKAFYHLKMAREYFQDVSRESPNTLAGRLSKVYHRKVEWMERDFRANPILPRFAIEDFKEDLNGDILFHESISTKCLKLSESQKEGVEQLIDSLIAGEEITAVIR